MPRRRAMARARARRYSPPRTFRQSGAGCASLMIMVAAIIGVVLVLLF